MIQQRERENPARPTISKDRWGWWAQGIDPVSEKLHVKLRDTPAEAYQMAAHWADKGYTDPEAQ